MVYTLLNASLVSPLSATLSRNQSPNSQQKFPPVVSCKGKLGPCCKPNKTGQEFPSSSPAILQIMFQKSVIPMAASIALVFGSNPAQAGILSGFTGIESVPGPELPQIDFLKRFNEENQKKYAENDARFKESPILKKLLERTQQNKLKNKQEILDKYCIRGAEWGVGDCSTDGMSPDDRDKFIAMLKQKAGVE